MVVVYVCVCVCIDETVGMWWVSFSVSCTRCIFRKKYNKHDEKKINRISRKRKWNETEEICFRVKISIRYLRLSWNSFQARTIFHYKRTIIFLRDRTGAVHEIIVSSSTYVYWKKIVSGCEFFSFFLSWNTYKKEQACVQNVKCTLLFFARR